jgi:hypothetical protein
MARQCPNCSADVIRKPGRGGLKTFCNPKCKSEFQARQMNEGRAILAFAKAWRECRNRKEDREIGAQALRELCKLVDEFNAKDRAAGRPRATEYVRRQFDYGYLYADRKRA